jgi:hypothetical protein
MLSVACQRQKCRESLTILGLETPSGGSDKRLDGPRISRGPSFLNASVESASPSA